MLLAVAYAFYRRLLLKPARLEPNREGLLVLGLITIIMITDFAFDAFRFAQLSGSVAEIAHEQAHAPIGGWLASLVADWTPAALATAAAISYWTQMITVCAFLVLLPLGEHFHIVTALPALFFRRGKPANAVPTVDLSPVMDDSTDASELKVGARSVADLVWKDALDAFTCTECGRCKDACPAFQTGKPLSMKGVNDQLMMALSQRIMTHWNGIKVDKFQDKDPGVPPRVLSTRGAGQCKPNHQILFDCHSCDITIVTKEAQQDGNPWK